MIHTELAILGGGASGLAAACAFTHNSGKKAVILESSSRTGKKILASGNGRCNLTNMNITCGNYYGDREFIASVLQRFGTQECLDFFKRIGLTFHIDRSGRVYPHSEQASCVRELLRAYAKNTMEITDFALLDVEKNADGFVLSSQNETVYAHKLLVATGGMASSNEKSARIGYEVMRKFGHSMTKIFPSLNQIKVTALHGLKGVRANGSVTLTADGRVACMRNGEIQFGDGTLSGICVFDISRFVGEYFTYGTVEGKKCCNIEIRIDLIDDMDFNLLKNLLFERREMFPNMEIGSFLLGILNNRLGDYLIGTIIKKPRTNAVKTLGSGDLISIARAIKEFQVTPCAIMPFTSAQVTAGGIKCNEFDPGTMESYKIDNLYAAGEILDCDGDCGGYNLHWAWATGVIAGESAAYDMKGCK